MTFLNYRFVIKEYTSYHYMNGKTFAEKVIGIGIKDEINQVVFPSPLTHFIRSKYRGKNKSLSSQRNAGAEIVKFLNYIRKQIQDGEELFLPLKEKGLFGLERRHASHYITYLSLKARNEELSPSYVYRIEKYLIHFFEWLVKNDLIEEKIVFGKDSPFNDLSLGTIYPGRDERVSDKLVDFGHNRYELVQKFIRISQDVAPEISLGICFQIFGGLRVGEIVNLTKDAFETPYFWNDNDFGEEKFIIKVRDRQKILFQNRSNLQHEGVKRPRNQALILDPLLFTVYKEHKKWLKKISLSCNVENDRALFLSPKTGEPLSGKNYKEKFNKVKRAFLKQLALEGRMEEYLFLTDKEWSTHIGRGIFTNFLLEMNANIVEVAIARGDRNIQSVMAYVEEKNALSITKEALTRIHDAFEEQKIFMKEEEV